MDTLILLMLWLTTLWLAYTAGKRRPKEKERERPPMPPPTEEERLQAAKEKREMENFWNFDGTNQDYSTE